MEYAIGALAVLLLALVAAHSYMAYKGIARRIKDPSNAIMLRPNLGITIPFTTLSLTLLLFAYPEYNSYNTFEGPHDIPGMTMMLVFFVLTFQMGWIPSLNWNCLEPGVAHVTRKFGFRQADVDASQVVYWHGETNGGALAASVYDLDDPLLRNIILSDVDDKPLFGAAYSRNCKAVVAWVKAYCPQALVYISKPKRRENDK